MPIPSGEIRSRVAQFRETDIRSETLSPDEQLIVAEIRKRYNAGRGIHVGEGRSGLVVTIDGWTEQAEHQGLKPWVIKSEQRLTPEQRALGLNLKKEAELQTTAHRIISEAQTRRPDLKFADIPSVHQLFYDTETEPQTRWLIMDYVEGETLFERALKQFLIHATDTSEADVHNLKKDDLLTLVLDDSVINLLPPRYVAALNGLGEEQLTELNEEQFIGIALEANRYSRDTSPVISANQYEQIKNTIQALHASGFHHRDLHSSNIIIQPDGNVAIIDFGLSLHDAQKTRDSVYTQTQESFFAAQTIRLPADLTMLDQYYKIARKGAKIAA